MADAIRLFGPVGALIRLLRVLLLDMRARQLDLDDVCAEQRRHVRGIGADIEREFAVLAQLAAARIRPDHRGRSEEHTSELQSLMRISYAVFCLKKKTIRWSITQQPNN